MSDPLSCVKCGAPRTVSICAYCGTRYTTDAGVGREYSADFMGQGAAIGLSIAERGLLRTGVGLSVLMPRIAMRIVG